MNVIFGEEYYKEEDKNEKEIKEYIDNVEQELDFNHDKELRSDHENELLKREKEEGLIPKANLPIFMRHKLTSDEIHNIQ